MSIDLYMINQSIDTLKNPFSLLLFGCRILNSAYCHSRILLKYFVLDVILPIALHIQLVSRASRFLDCGRENSDSSVFCPFGDHEKPPICLTTFSSRRPPDFHDSSERSNTSMGTVPWTSALQCYFTVATCYSSLSFIYVSSRLAQSK